MALNKITSKQVTYLPVGAGAVASDLQDKLRESVSAFDFMTSDQVADVQSGAASLDVTDALQAAITEAGIGGRVTLPVGRYRLTGTITPLNNQHIVFDGAGVTLKMDSASVAMMFNLSGKSRVRLDGNGATLDGNKAVSPSGIMIDLDDAKNCYLGYFKVINAPAGGYGSIEVRGLADGNVLDHLEGYDSDGSFIAIDGSSTGETPTNTEIIAPYVKDAAQFGIRVGLASDVTIRKPKCTSNGIEMVGVTHAGSRVKVIEPDISGCGDNGISFSGDDNVCIGGEVSNNQKAGVWCWGSNNRVIGVRAVNNNLEDAGNNWSGFGASANYGGCGQDNMFIGCVADDTQAAPTQWNGVRFAGSSYLQWETGTPYSSGTYVYYGLNVYLIVGSGTSGATPPTHTAGQVSDGGVVWRYINTFVTEVDSVRNVAQVRTLRFKSSAYQDSTSGGNYDILNSYSRVIARQPSSISLTGTLAETTLRSANVKKNTLGAFGAIKLRAYGTLTGAGGTKTVRLKFGATTILTQTYSAGATWILDVVIGNVSSVGTQRMSGVANRSSDAIMNVVFGAAAENTTTDLTLAISGQLSNAGDTMTIQEFFVETVRRDV